MKINIHITTYIFLLISFLSGYFEYMFLFLLTIFIHEFGHIIFGMFFKFRSPTIIIYPFGGISYFNEELNTKIYKELIVLLGGIIFQLLFLLFIIVFYNNGYITFHVYNIILKINYLLISFNFMPIIPLDGGKLLNIILDIFLPYKLSNKVSIFISIIFIIIFLISKISIYVIILSIFLINRVMFEVSNLDYKYYLFLYERYINNYKFNKLRIINNINNLKRDYKHIINNEYECIYLHKLFDTIK